VSKNQTSRCDWRRTLQLLKRYISKGFFQCRENVRAAFFDTRINVQRMMDVIAFARRCGAACVRTYTLR